MAGPPQSTIGKKLPSRAPLQSICAQELWHLHHREAAQLEATIRHHHKISEKELDIPENGIPLSEAGE